MHTPQTDACEQNTDKIRTTKNASEQKKCLGKKGGKYRLESQICSDVNWKQQNIYAYNKMMQSRETPSKTLPLKPYYYREM